MILSNNILAPSIFLYKNGINFSETISTIVTRDTKGWNIKNQKATDWEFGEKIIGYDEYPVNFSFSINENFLILAKKIFDHASDYATKNLTKINTFDYCVIRKYSSSPGFLELESSDVDNPSRKLTAILFLSIFDQDNKIVFKNFDLEIAAQQGDIIIFPASFAYSFKINRPKKSDSLILVSHFL